jgi:hypothetical protein
MCMALLAPRPVRKVKPGLVEPEFQRCIPTPVAAHLERQRRTSQLERMTGEGSSSASDLQPVGLRERNGHLHALNVSQGSMRDRLKAERLMATESP